MSLFVCMMGIAAVLRVLGASRNPSVARLNKTTAADSFYGKAAAVTNSEICTNVALDVLSEDGSAADAAIAALLCEGVTNPQSMGIGGGFLLTIYNAANRSAEVLNAREAAPIDACEDMFGNNPEDDIASGGLSVAVPGELMGYWELHRKYGRMAWYDLFRPAIELCRNGVPVPHYTGRMIEMVKDEILQSPTIKDLLTNPATGALYKEGERMIRPELADTLLEVAKHGPTVLYDGNMTEEFVDDITENGGIITKEDLKNYKVKWEPALTRTIDGFRYYTTPPPGSGSLLLLIIAVMAENMPCKEDDLFWHQLVETWKFAYGIRGGMTGPNIHEQQHSFVFDESNINKTLAKLLSCGVHGKPEDYFLKQRPVEDHGTSHICIVAPNGDAVSVTSTINLSFGSMFVSESTGIILNNEMMDFSIPHHPVPFKSHGGNRIAPGRQPMSTMSPTIIVGENTGDARLVIGSSGGFKILTSMTTVILRNLYFSTPIQEAVDHERLHHQLMPYILEYEEGFPKEILLFLLQNGHKLQQLDIANRVNSSASMAMHSCVNAIAQFDDKIYPASDSRRNAYAGGY